MNNNRQSKMVYTSKIALPRIKTKPDPSNASPKLDYTNNNTNIKQQFGEHLHQHNNHSNQYRNFFQPPPSPTPSPSPTPTPSLSTFSVPKHSANTNNNNYKRSADTKHNRASIQSNMAAAFKENMHMSTGNMAPVADHSLMGRPPIANLKLSNLGSRNKLPTKMNTNLRESTQPIKHNNSMQNQMMINNSVFKSVTERMMSQEQAEIGNNRSSNNNNNNTTADNGSGDGENAGDSEAEAFNGKVNASQGAMVMRSSGGMQQSGSDDGKGNNRAKKSSWGFAAPQPVKSLDNAIVMFPNPTYNDQQSTYRSDDGETMIDNTKSQSSSAANNSSPSQSTQKSKPVQEFHNNRVTKYRADGDAGINQGMTMECRENPTHMQKQSRQNQNQSRSLGNNQNQNPINHHQLPQVHRNQINNHLTQNQKQSNNHPTQNQNQINNHLTQNPNRINQLNQHQNRINQLNQHQNRIHQLHHIQNRINYQLNQNQINHNLLAQNENQNENQNQNHATQQFGINGNFQKKTGPVNNAYVMPPALRSSFLKRTEKTVMRMSHNNGNKSENRPPSPAQVAPGRPPSPASSTRPASKPQSWLLSALKPTPNSPTVIRRVPEDVICSRSVENSPEASRKRLPRETLSPSSPSSVSSSYASSSRHRDVRQASSPVSDDIQQSSAAVSSSSAASDESEEEDED